MSKRVLLLIDDYAEGLRIETVLRKVGFDVVSRGSETQLDNELIAFNPEVVVAGGSTSQVSPLSVGAKLKRHRTFAGSVILGFPPGMNLGPEDFLKVRVDQILQYPFDIHRLIEILAVLTETNSGQLLEKLRKLSVEMPEIRPKKTERRALTEREIKYQAYTQELQLDKNKTTFVRSEVKEQWGEVKKSWDLKALDTLKDLKSHFVKALFSLTEKK